MTDLTEKDTRHVADILHFAGLADRLVAQGQASYFAAGDQAELNRHAAVGLIISIATAAARLSNEFVEAHPQVPWQQIRGMRNLLAHRYESINDDLVWATLAKAIPNLAKALM
ncbi:MAG: DUF86 domain-containing protein [Micrococcales bacterium]|nr:DUF86 domain-containing protein [Micrococcales bacterium]